MSDVCSADLFAALQTLPDHLSTPHKAFDHGLKSEIDAIRLGEDDYKVFGGRANEGAVIVSQEDYPVDFSRNLACRVGNIVPIDSFETRSEEHTSELQSLMRISYAVF